MQEICYLICILSKNKVFLELSKNNANVQTGIQRSKQCLILSHRENY